MAEKEEAETSVKKKKEKAKLRPPTAKEQKLLASLRVDKPEKYAIDAIPTRIDDGGPANKKEAHAEVALITHALQEWQEKLYAEAKRSLLVVFQAMDTGGKDGTTRHVFGPLNPQGVTVANFKQPTTTELARDYLWRVHAVVPRRGYIGIFNRSHYEDLLVPLVNGGIGDKTLKKRFGQINDFERMLTDNGTTILKFFLHISKDEQAERLQSRLDVKRKNWKFNVSDLKTRDRWAKYQKAYETVVRRCSTPDARWHVIPADRKWFRDWAVARITLAAMEAMAPAFPPPAEGLDKVKIK